MIVYVYTFPNGKRYVGQTNQTLERRARKGEGYKNSPLVYAAIKKYGWNNIDIDIIDCSSEKEMDDLEILLIETYQTAKREFGYNLEFGGKVGKTLSKETKDKLSEKLKGREPWNKGKVTGPMAQETKNKISEKLKGRTLSEETKEKVRKAVVARECKTVICIETGEEYESCAAAARAIPSADRTAISRCCNRRPDSTSGGFHWKFKE